MSEAPLTSATVIGAGSWGLALARLLAERGLRVQLWGRDAEALQVLRTSRQHPRYLPQTTLPANVTVTADWAELQPAEAVLFAVPSTHLGAITAQAASIGAVSAARVLVSCSKGIELASGRRMSEVIAAAAPGPPVAVLTGPNHAEEVARRLATATVVACAHTEAARALQAALTLPWFRCYTTDDVTGAEWGGALKNPYAIAAGIAKGLQLGDNAIAALVTRALAEMVRFGVAMGGRAETFYGLSGVGDLMTTCFSEHSRNHRVGLALGRGQSLTEILAASSMVAEGVPNTASLYRAAQKAGARTPLLDEIHAVLYEGKPPALAMRDLLARDPRPENG